MLKAPIPPDDAQRLQDLRATRLLDTPPEPVFDSIVQLIKTLFDAPICLVSLVDADRQWFKAAVGLNAPQTPRDISFCGHAILGKDVFVIRDAFQDTRFQDNPLVVGPPFIRFYAGAPIQTRGKQTIGTICIIDSAPRPDFDQASADKLAAVAKVCEQMIHARTEAALTAEVLKQLPVGVVLRLPSGEIVNANPAFSRMVGLERNDLPGMMISALATSGGADHREQEAEALHRGKGFGPFPMEFIRADGGLVPAEISSLLIERDVSPLILSVVEDITARRKIEFELIQAQKMEAIGQLTGGLAHDFNNMLGVIVGNLDLMEKGLAEQPALLRKMETARTAALRGADLTHALLSVARKQAMRSEPVDLNARLAELLPLLQHTVGGSIDVVMDLEQLPMVEVDSSGLASTILNLAINARDAMPKGGRLTLRTRPRLILFDDSDDGLQPGHYVALSVSDTGVGMSADILARAADPFFTTKERGGGTGLGLAMAKGFAKQSRGDFRIYSEIYHGTSISLLLPVTAQVTLVKERQAMPRGMGERILVVDDELELLAVTSTWLTDLGYEVTPSVTPRSAMAALNEARSINRPYDMLVTDVIMPGMDGFSLASACRQLQQNLRLLYVSGFADAADRTVERVKAELLQKPFRQSELAFAVARALGEQEDTPA